MYKYLPDISDYDYSLSKNSSRELFISKFSVLFYSITVAKDYYRDNYVFFNQVSRKAVVSAPDRIILHIKEDADSNKALRQKLETMHALTHASGKVFVDKVVLYSNLACVVRTVLSTISECEFYFPAKSDLSWSFIYAVDSYEFQINNMYGKYMEGARVSSPAEWTKAISIMSEDFRLNGWTQIQMSSSILENSLKQMMDRFDYEIYLLSLKHCFWSVPISIQECEFYKRIRSGVPCVIVDLINSSYECIYWYNSITQHKASSLTHYDFKKLKNGFSSLCARMILKTKCFPKIFVRYYNGEYVTEEVRLNYPGKPTDFSLESLGELSFENMKSHSASIGPPVSGEADRWHWPLDSTSKEIPGETELSGTLEFESISPPLANLLKWTFPSTAKHSIMSRTKTIVGLLTVGKKTYGITEEGVAIPLDKSLYKKLLKNIVDKKLDIMYSEAIVFRKDLQSIIDKTEMPDLQKVFSFKF